MLAALALNLISYGQTGNEPNRLIISDNIGNYKGYVIDRVDGISFERVDGEVKAEIEIKEVTLEGLKVAILRDFDCEGYKLDVLPRVLADQLTDPLQVISYISRNATTYYQDFTDADLTGIELKPDTKYTLFTVGIDKFGVEGDICRADFTTPSIPIVGNPHVETTVIDTSLFSFTVEFTPNSDVSSYYAVAGPKGVLESQFEMFGPGFGFSNITDMIIGWGTPRTGNDVVEWKDMEPNTLHEIYIAVLDANGNAAPYQVIEVSTLSLGGDGEASVSISLGDYKLAEWDGEMKPSQFIKYTPNDQASCFRVGVYKAEIYDSSTNEIKAELCSDPFMPTENWFFYEEFETDFQIDPGTAVVAIAAAKNANGKWGPVTELRFTTPDTFPTYAHSSPAIIESRIKTKKTNKGLKAGYFPTIGRKEGIRLK